MIAIEHEFHLAKKGENMFAVKVCIYTDGDFGYEDPEFNIENLYEDDDGEKIFYFKNRKDAVDAIVRSFHNLKNTLRHYGRERIKGWIDSMDNRIELITKKILTFRIEKDFGNQSILYELSEVKKRELGNKSFCYDFCDVDVDFSWYEEETIRWDEVVNFPNVEG